MARNVLCAWLLGGALMALGGCAAAGPGSLHTGLVAEYLFDGSAADSSGNGYDGQAFRAVLTADRFGRADQAYAFDGRGAYIVIWPPPQLSDKALAISVWARYNESEFERWNNCIIAQDDGGYPDLSSRVFQLSTLGRFICWHRMDDSPDLVATRRLEPDVWYHVVVTFDGDLHRLYINGVLNDAREGTLWSQPLEPIFIGRKGSWEPVFLFDGAIDDVRIYNRGLTPRDVRILYEER